VPTRQDTEVLDPPEGSIVLTCGHHLYAVVKLFIFAFGMDTKVMCHSCGTWRHCRLTMEGQEQLNITTIETQVDNNGGQTA
jgi:hypothetical protein